MDSSVDIRVAVESDLEQIALLEQQMFRSPWSLAQLQSSLGGQRWIAVALQKNLLVGYLVASHGAGVADLLTIGVDPCRQGRGVGRLLLGRLFQQLQYEQVDELFLEVRQSNTAALALYRHCGFEQVAVRKGYYCDGTDPEDAIVMRKTGLGIE